MAKENEFIDAVGESWVCRFNTPALLDAGRDLNVTPALLETPEQINIGIMGRLVWYAVRNLANARGVSKKQFEEERMTLAVLPYAVRATFAALAVAFPNDIAEEQQPKRPLAVGGGSDTPKSGETSMN